jgi:hypothetical protein
MTVLKSNHLTSDPVDDAAIETFPGMASWAGGGPQFTNCKHCKFFERAPIKVPVKNDPNKPARCAMFRQITGREGPAVPAEALSCRFYQPGTR